MKSPGITRDQILISLHNADQLHIRPSGEARNETHRVIVIQPDHRKPHRRFCILGICAQSRQPDRSGEEEERFFHRQMYQVVCVAIHLSNPFYFTPNFCLSQDMDAALPPLTASTLYLVATPIGNLEDITLRALRVFPRSSVGAAGDARPSGQLLKYFGISKPLLSYFQFNGAKRSEEIIERLRRGEKVAVEKGR